MQAEPRSSRAVDAGIALSLAGLTVAAFARAVGHDFVSLDDPSYVVQNPHVIGGLSLDGVRWAFTHFYSFNWHPLTWISHMADVSVFGPDPAGHHLTSVLVHAASAALLFLALRRMSGDRWPSALAAALFALHPLRVESVAWVAERKDLLAGFFWMAALLAHCAYVRRPGVLRQSAVAAAMAAGLMCKPMIVTLPLVLLLLDVWPLRRLESPARRVAEKLPLFGLAAASAVITVAAQQAGGAVRSLEAIPLAARAANALVSGAVYLGRWLWPSDLAVFYPHPALLGRADALLWPAVGAGLLLAALTGLAVAQLRRRPYWTVGWLWFGITLLPVIGLVQVGGQATADRYTYLPTVGLGIAVAWGLRDLVNRLALPPRACTATALALLTGLAALSWRQLATWRDTETLFRHATEATRDNYFAHANLASYYRAAGRPELAQPELEAALAARPRYVPARIELGRLHTQRGDLESAAAELEAVLAARPGSARAQNALGLVRLREDRLDDARRHLERAVARSPDFAEAHNNLGLVLRRQGHDEAAARHFRRALRLRPDAEHPRANLRAMGLHP